MTESNGNRTLFQSLRVPFDLKAIFLAFLGLVVLWAGGQVLDLVFESASDNPKARINTVTGVVHQALDKLHMPLQNMPVIGRELSITVTKLFGARQGALTTFQFVLGLVWWFMVLAVFGGAICRVVASRIARDEGVGVRQALKFSLGNIQHYLAAPLFVALAILFFWACILLAGVVISIPVIGPILSIVLYPLVILSGLVIILIGFAGVLGLFLMISAVSTERNGALDAISRAFSYIYSRPLQFFFAYFLIFLFAYIILLVGGIFIDITGSSFQTGVWSRGLEVAVDRNVGSDALTPNFTGGQGFFCLAAFWIWLLHRILWWGIGGYAIYYIFGGTTSVYFQLRHDVDGTEESEIYLEDGEEDEFDFSVTDTSETPPPAAEPADAAAEPADAADEPADAADEKEEAPEEKKEEEPPTAPDAEQAPEEKKEGDGEEAPEEEDKSEGE